MSSRPGLVESTVAGQPDEKWLYRVGAISALVLTSPLEVVYAIVTLSSGILVIGLVMFRGRFGRFTAGLAVVTGVLGIVSLAGLAVTIILNAVCATVWLFFVGAGLARLARS